MKLKLVFSALIVTGTSTIFLPLIHPTAVKAASISEREIAHTEEHHGHDGQGEHPHGAIAVPADRPIPSVRLIVHPDAQSGWNLEVRVENFRFAPERVNTDSNTVEGHAHLFVNGQKVTRLYGNWYYLPRLPAGRNEIKVSLNTNRHEMLMHDGEEIAATAIVEVP